MNSGKKKYCDYKHLAFVKKDEARFLETRICKVKKICEEN